MDKEENGIEFGTPIEQPKEENEHSPIYWLKNHKFVVILFAAAFVSTIVGIVSFIIQLIKDWKETLLLVGGLSPIIILGIVCIIWAAIDMKKNKEKDLTNKDK